VKNNKHFILNADDFGLSTGANQAILQGCIFDLLKSASICTNGDFFNDAVKIIPQCKNLGLGIHLNVIEGKSLAGVSLLTDKYGKFNKGFLTIFLKSFSKRFLQDVESEFRLQIEKGLYYFKIDHLDSHVHTHGIPAIFKIALRLSIEYHIPFIRTQYEHFYIVPKLQKNICIGFFVNIIKIMILNFFSMFNKIMLRQTTTRTNDNIIGVGYTGMMDSDTIKYGLQSYRKGNITEALIHPNVNTNLREYNITKDTNLIDTINKMGIHITNYGSL
jgi:hypothetical protein